MTLARTAFRWLIWLFVLGVGVQFFLAGLGVLGGENLDPHRGMGSFLQLLSVVMLPVAATAKLEKRLLIMSLVLSGLTILQSVWALEDLKPMWLRSFHVLGAFGIVGLSQHMAREVGWPLSNQQSN